MQSQRGSGDLRDPFGMFGGLGSFGGFGGSIFGRNPFDDPFFSRPFGSMLDNNNPVVESQPPVQQNGPVIRELGSDDEQDMEVEGEEGQKSSMSNNEPFVDHPDDETEDGHKQENNRADYNKAQISQPQTFKVHTCKVTYGGIDGVYYSSSATRKMGSDGVIMEECKEADKTTGEATHRVSRGLHNKGHSVTRKLNSNGKVDTLQTLHNLNEDELGGFEEAWNGNFGRHLSPWSGSSTRGSNHMSNWGGSSSLVSSVRPEPSTQRPRNVVRIPIE